MKPKARLWMDFATMNVNAASELKKWIEQNKIRVLNVAGHRTAERQYSPPSSSYNDLRVLAHFRLAECAAFEKRNTQQPGETV
jgi:hypothetical protein